MANIVLTNSARFSPYSFDEMLKPLAMATQEQRAIEEGISELGTKADLMRMYANEEPDSDWAKKYNEYANNLDKQAEDLAKHGLNPTSRQGLLNLKRQYGDAVTPIEEAIAARKEAYKYRDTIKAKDNTAMFKNKTLSLSDFMNGKEGDNTYISGKDIMARVASKAQIEGTNLFNSLLEQGYTSEAALQAVNNWSRNTANPIIAEELKAIGYENYSPEDQAKLMNSIGTGMYNAASEIAKGEYMTAYQRKNLKLAEDKYNRQVAAEEMAKKKFKADLAAKGLKETEDGNIVFDENSPLVLKDANGNIIGLKKDFKKNKDGSYTAKSSTARIYTSKYPKRREKQSDDLWSTKILTGDAPDIKDAYPTPFENLPSSIQRDIRNDVIAYLGEDATEEDIRMAIALEEYYLDKYKEVFYSVPKNIKVVNKKPSNVTEEDRVPE